MPATQAPILILGRPPRAWLKKAVVCLVTMTMLVVFYSWVSPWAYPRERQLGFGYGTLHGAIMPMALPALLAGKNVDIFAANNSGRAYKIGYIVGINVCGIIVFGAAFWMPARHREEHRAFKAHPSSPDSP